MDYYNPRRSGFSLTPSEPDPFDEVENAEATDQVGLNPSDDLTNLQVGMGLTGSTYQDPIDKVESNLESGPVESTPPFSLAPNSTQELIGGLQYAEVEKQKAIKLDEPKWEEYKRLKAEGKSPTVPWSNTFLPAEIDVVAPDEYDPVTFKSVSTFVTPEQTTFTPAQKRQYDVYKSKFPNSINITPLTNAEKEKEHALSQLAKKQPFIDAATNSKSEFESGKRALRKQYNLDGTLRPDNLRYVVLEEETGEETPLDVFGKKIEGFPRELVPSKLPKTYKEAESLLGKFHQQTLDGIKYTARVEGITSGVLDAAVGLVSPENITLMIGTGFASAPMKVAISSYFSITMGIGAYEATNAALEARERGDAQDEAYLWTSALFSATMAVFAGKHALSKTSAQFKLESPEVRATFSSNALIYVFNKQLRNDKGLPYVLDFDTAAEVKTELLGRGFEISSRPTKQSMFFPDTKTSEGFFDMEHPQNIKLLNEEIESRLIPLVAQITAKENEKLVAAAIPQLVETASPISAQSLMDSFKINHTQARVLMGFARVSGLDLNKILVSTYEKMDAAGLSPVVGANRGFFIPLDEARAIISGLTDPSAHTGIHEINHVVRRQIVSRDYSGDHDYRLSLPEIIVLEEWAGAKDGVWPASADEKFSNSFTRYLADNDSVSVEMKGIFGKIKKYLLSIYEEVKRYLEVSDEIKSIFDKIANKELRKKANEASPDVAPPVSAETSAAIPVVATTSPTILAQSPTPASEKKLNKKDQAKKDKQDEFDANQERKDDLARALNPDDFPTTTERILGNNPTLEKGSAENLIDAGRKIQELGLAYLKKEKIDPATITPEQITLIAKIAVKEIIYNLSRGKNASDWYTGNIKEMLKIAELIFPELGKDSKLKLEGFKKSKDQQKDANFIYRLAFAVTSQNLNVVENSKWAIQQYEYFRENGKFDPSIDVGSKAASISGNLKLANDLIEKIGIDALNKFCESTLKKEEALKFLKDKLGRDVTISGGTKLDEILGSAIFGPKIGGGFLSNLLGNFDPITIDLWMRRTWGRWTGNSVGNGVTAENLAKFLDATRADGIFSELSNNNREPVWISQILVETRNRKSGGKTFRTVSPETLQKIRSNAALEERILDKAREVQSNWQKKYSFVRMPISPENLGKVESGEWGLLDVVANAEKAYALASKIASGKFFTKGEAAGFLPKNADGSAYVPKGFKLTGRGSYEPIEGHDFNEYVSQKKLQKAIDKEAADKAEDAGDDIEGAVVSPSEATEETLKKVSLRVRAFDVMKKDFGYTEKISNPTVSEKLKTLSALASQAYINSYKVIDIPSEADRKAIKLLFKEVQKMLHEQDIYISNADIQAILWYPEKEIWNTVIGAKNVTALNLSYSDSMATFARLKGHGDAVDKILNENKPPTTPTNDKSKRPATVAKAELAARGSASGGQRTDQSGASNAVTDTGTESGVRSGDAEKVKGATRPIVEEIQKILTDAIAKGGKVTAKAKQTIRDLVTAKFLPKITPTEKLIADLPSQETVSGAIEEGQRNRASTLNAFNLNEEVTLRQDVKAWTRNGVGVVVVRQEATDGIATHAYVPMAIIENVVFDTSQNAILKTAAGGWKRSNLATVRGKLSASQDIPADITTWTQVGFNPDRHTYFYPKADHTQVVLSGDAAMQIGNTVFVKNPVYATKAEAAKFLFQEEQIDYSSTRNSYNDLSAEKFGVSTPRGQQSTLQQINDDAQRMIRISGKKRVYEMAELAKQGDMHYMTAAHVEAFTILRDQLEKSLKKSGRDSVSAKRKGALLTTVIGQIGTMYGKGLRARANTLDPDTGRRIIVPEDYSEEEADLFNETESNLRDKITTAREKVNELAEEEINDTAAEIVNKEKIDPKIDDVLQRITSVATSYLRNKFSINRGGGLSQLAQITKDDFDIFAKAMCLYSDKPEAEFKLFLDAFLKEHDMPPNLFDADQIEYIHYTAYLYKQDAINGNGEALIDGINKVANSSVPAKATSATAKAAEAAKPAAAKVEMADLSAEEKSLLTAVYGLPRFEALTPQKRALVLKQSKEGYSWNLFGYPYLFDFGNLNTWKLTSPRTLRIANDSLEKQKERLKHYTEVLKESKILGVRGKWLVFKDEKEKKERLKGFTDNLRKNLTKDYLYHYKKLGQMSPESGIAFLENEILAGKKYLEDLNSQLDLANKYLGLDQKETQDEIASWIEDAGNRWRFSVEDNQKYFKDLSEKFKKLGLTETEIKWILSIETNNNSLFWLIRARGADFTDNEIALDSLIEMREKEKPSNAPVEDAPSSPTTKPASVKATPVTAKPAAVKPTEPTSTAESESAKDTSLSPDAKIKKAKAIKAKVEKSSEDKKKELIDGAKASAKAKIDEAEKEGKTLGLDELIDQTTVYQYVKSIVADDPTREWTRENIMGLFKYVADMLNQEVLEPAGYSGGITATEARDIYTQHGITKYPSTEELNVKLAQLRRLGDLMAKWEEAKRGEMPKITGTQQAKPIVLMREIQKEITVLMRKLKMTDVDVDGAMRSARQKRIAGLQNKLEDIQYQITEGKRTEKPAPIAWTDEELALKAQIATLNDQLDELLGETDTAEIQRIVDRIERQTAILNSGNLFKPKITPTAKSAAVTEALDRLADINRKLAEARRAQRLLENPLKTEEEKSINRLEKILAILTAENETGIYFTEKEDIVQDSEAIKALRDRIYEERAKKLSTNAPIVFADDVEISFLTDQITKVEEMLSSGDFGSKPIKGKRVTNDDAVLALRETLKSLRSDLSEARKAKKLKDNPPPTEEDRYLATLDRLIAIRKEQIESGDFQPTAKVTRMLTDRIKERQATLDSLNKQVFELRKEERLRLKPNLTKSQILIKAIDKQIASIERQIDTNVLDAPKELSKNTDPEVLRKRKLLEEAKANLDAKFSMGENAEIAKLREEIARLQADINGYTPKPRVFRTKSQAIQDLIDEKKSLNQLRQQTWKESEAGEAYDLEKFAERTADKIAEFERRIREGDTSPLSKKPKSKSRKKQEKELELGLEKAKRDYENFRKKLEYAEMTFIQKRLYDITYLSHEMLMFSVMVIPKLATTASVTTLVTSPLAEGFGYLNAKIFPSLRNADVETAQTFKELMKGEYAGLAGAVYYLFDDLVSTWTLGKPMYETQLLGARADLRTAYVSRVHALMKVVPSRQAYERTMYRLLAQLEKEYPNPRDIPEGLLASKAMEKFAVGKAQEAKFQQQNSLAMAISSVATTVADGNKTTEAVVKLFTKSEMPVATVALNLFQTFLKMQYGTPVALGRLTAHGLLEYYKVWKNNFFGDIDSAEWFEKTYELMDKKTANSVQDQLKTGQVGLAIGIMAYYLYNKRKHEKYPEELEAFFDEEKVSRDVFGMPMDRSLIESPASQLLLFWTQVFEQLDRLERKGDNDPSSKVKAFTSVEGLAFMRTPPVQTALSIAKLVNPKTSSVEAGRILRIPLGATGPVFQIAKALDPIDSESKGFKRFAEMVTGKGETKRKPTTLWEALTVGYPLLRNEVPKNWKKNQESLVERQKEKDEAEERKHKNKK
jgi:hypothetical protein